MAAVSVLTPTIDPTAKGAILTFVTPAMAGCGMACSYCFIGQRRERVRHDDLGPDAYVEFIRGAAANLQIKAVTLQGYEPLAPESIPWTRAILSAGRDIGAETGLVTNGLYLEENAELLADIGCDGVTVSIDADTAAEHDRMRHRPGAWSSAMSGLAAAIDSLGSSAVIVHSVMFPGHADRLVGVPEVLADIGILQWAVSSAVSFRRDGMAFLDGDPLQIRSDFALLAAAADAAGIRFIADDELGMLRDKLGNSVPIPQIAVRTLSRPDGLLRLGPDGSCSFGTKILTTRPAEAPRWKSGDDVSSFLRGRLGTVPLHSYA